MYLTKNLNFWSCDLEKVTIRPFLRKVCLSLDFNTKYLNSFQELAKSYMDGIRKSLNKYNTVLVVEVIDQYNLAWKSLQKKKNGIDDRRVRMK